MNGKVHRTEDENERKNHFAQELLEDDGEGESEEVAAMVNALLNANILDVSEGEGYGSEYGKSTDFHRFAEYRSGARPTGRVERG